ncbi:uncharacterized protein V1510DRAFT_104060, partial [Dipodascopsis tothii]|uniref:uncharacterized protein n=1 Tax=Dipodascopsis tothii TaxID=44089 RepID=UPI0034CD47F8
RACCWRRRGRRAVIVGLGVRSVSPSAVAGPGRSTRPPKALKSAAAQRTGNTAGETAAERRGSTGADAHSSAREADGASRPHIEAAAGGPEGPAASTGRMGVPVYGNKAGPQADADKILLEKLQCIKQIIDILPAGVYSMCQDRKCVDSACGCRARGETDAAAHVHCQDDVDDALARAALAGDDKAGDDKAGDERAGACVGVVEKYTYEKFCDELNVNDRFVKRFLEILVRETCSRTEKNTRQRISELNRESQQRRT